MALSWRAKRQLRIIGGLIFLVVIFVFIFIAKTTSITPTCFDSKQNGDELGVDCGGSCINYCPNTLKYPSVIWARSFETSDTVVNSVAYIENQNTDAISSKVSYEFRLYDADRKFIAERVGSTYIGQTGPFAVFEGGIIVGNRDVRYTDFRFTTIPVWSKPNTRFKDIKLISGDGLIENLGDKPRLLGTVKNESSFFTVSEIDVIGIVYDSSGNAIGVSKTFIENLEPKEEKEVIFTWREVFNGEPVKTEIISRYNPFSLGN